MNNPPATEEPASPSEAPAVPTTMRAAVARRYGTPEVITVEEIAVPVPRADELLIKIEASSLNALDWHFLTGTPYFLRLIAGLRRPKRIVPGADVAGIVAAVGSEVSDFRPGDAVFGECEGGGCAGFLTTKVNTVVAKPPEVSFQAAGATGAAGLTALQGLWTHGNVQPGDEVLINGAAGGVGTFAVQIAKALGANVTAVCSARNVKMVSALGADRVIDYTTQDFVDCGQRFDLMFDNVGNRTPAECKSVLQPKARYVLTTGPKNNRLLDPMPYVVRSALSFKRAEQSFHQFTASPNRKDLTFLGELLVSGDVTPQIQRVVGLDGVAAGLAEIGTGHAKAKIAVVPE